MAEMYQRDPLFIGDSEIDQIHKIFQVLGTPNEQIWPGINRLPDFRRNFPNWNGNKLRNRLPQLDLSAFDLLSKMLDINPSNRITAKEALEHPFLKQ